MPYIFETIFSKRKDVNMNYLLGVDLGTSGTKTVLFDEDGNVVASKTIEYPLYQEKNGWAEQEPLDWWNAAADTIHAVITESGVDNKDIKGLGISGQMHGLVMLDKDGNVLRRSIIWCDQRTAKECEEITARVGAERLIEITANPALTGFTASKILWVRNNQPEIYAKCAHILLPKDYVRYMLTGDFATEVSDASGMQLLDVPNRCWSDEVLEKLDIDDEETVRSLIESKNTPDLTQFIKENVDSDPEKRRYSEILLQLPDLFGGAEVFDKAEKLFAGTALSDRLTELKETFDALRKLEAEDKITVDLGLVNKAEYYTGIVFRGYIEEYGQAVLSGGRYDTLIGSFGADDMPAVGFAVNVNAIAAANLRSNRSTKARHAEVLVFAADEDLIDGISHCTKLISKGISAEFSTCPTLDAAMEYAKANKIGRIDIIDKEKNEQPVTMTL